MAGIQVESSHWKDLDTKQIVCLICFSIYDICEVKKFTREAIEVSCFTETYLDEYSLNLMQPSSKPLSCNFVVQDDKDINL